MSEETIGAAEETEFDFSKDSAVDVGEFTWKITEFEVKETEGENGNGVQHVFTFESDDYPYPVKLRQFVDYTPVDPTKDTSWVKRSRGVLKNLAKAISEDGKSATYSTNPNSASYPVGKFVKATTRDNGEGFATLTRFKRVS